VVHGVIRRSSTFNTQRIEHLYKDRHNAGACLPACLPLHACAAE